MSVLTPRAVPRAASWIDAAVVITLAIVASVGFAPAFDGLDYLGPAIGGLVVGALAATVGAIYRLSAVLSALVAALAYFAFGSLFAMSSSATLGFLPNGDTVSGLVVGAVFGWADVVTLDTPIGAPPYITVVPYVAGWLVSLVGVTLALRWLPSRPRFSPAAGSALLAGPAVLFVTGILIGTHDAYFAAARGVSFAIVSVVWLGWRSRPTVDNGGTRGRLVRRRKLAGTAVLVAAAVAAGSVSGFVLSPPDGQRFVVRDHVEPPFDLREFRSPLSTFRVYSKLKTDETIFTVEGLEAGQVIRLVALDSFDGVLWSVSGAEQAGDGSGSYSLVGENMPAVDFDVASSSSVQITIGDYADVWLPTIDYATSVVFEGPDARTLATDLRYNAVSGTALVTAGLREGDRYAVEAVLPASPTDLADVSPASVSLPPAAAVQVVGAKAVEFAGSAGTPYAKLDAIADYLRTHGYLRHGLVTEAPPSSRAGHGSDRLIQLFSSANMVGDAEQFASAFALMARSLGYPSRVVMGFVPPEGSVGTVEVTGSDVSAWVEVAFDGVGWVPFFPTPDQTEVPPDQVPEPQIKPQPQVRQPPRAIENPEDLLSPIEIDDEEKPDDSVFSIPAWVWLVAGSVGIPALILLLPLVAVGAIRRRRRSRRRRAGSPTDRIAGGWDELLDSYSELGFSLTPRRTRRQVAGEIAEKAAVEHGALLTLASGADRAVFSGRDSDPTDVDEFWARALAEIERISSSAGRWRRLVNRFYVRPGSPRRHSGSRNSL